MSEITPHQHAELIKKWADGAKIERFLMGHGMWVEDENPAWYSHYDYRVKPEPEPEPKPDVTRYYKALTLHEHTSSFDERSIFQLYERLPWEEYSLRLTFSGETGKLIKAEVIG